MCGIVGYTGPREAGPILIEGLRRLEYRATTPPGSRSSTRQGDLFVEKKAGKLANLQTAIADRTPHAAIGLAHTRWATHGRPNDLNAHPHQDCTGNITVIHNGIIENFRELRDGLEARGHVLTSETDTEAIAHLVEEAYQGDLADAVRASLRQVEGAYALVVMHQRRGQPPRRRPPQRAARRGAQRRGELHRERRLGDPRPHRTASCSSRRATSPTSGPTGVDVTGSTGCRGSAWSRSSTGPPRPPRRAATTTSCSRRSTSSPRRSASRSRAGSRPTAGSTRPRSTASTRSFRRVTRVEIVACGTASFAGLVGAAAIQDWTGLPARVTVGSEFRYSPPPLDANTLVVAVTQSGETADTIAPTRWAREQGCPIVAITNTVGSAITREADAVMFLQAGPEIAVAASKTFVTQVTTLIVLAAAIAKARGSMGAEQELELGHALRALPDAAAGRSSSTREHRGPRAAVRQLAGVHVHRPRLHYPGGARGRAQAQGDQLHARRGLCRGRAEARPDLAARRRVPAGDRRDPLADLRQADQQRHGGPGPRRAGHRRGDRGRRQIHRSADDVLWVPDTHEALSPALAVIPLQLFAYHTAVARGTDVDQPRNLAKSVTVE